jgi:hypothetical protein
MDSNANQLTKMLVLKPEVYKQIMKDLLTDTHLSMFDKRMRNILKGAHSSDAQKWMLYKNELIRHADIRRQHKTADNFNFGMIPSIQPKKIKKMYESKESQTRPPPRKISGFSQTIPTEYASSSTQTNPSNNDDVFEYENDIHMQTLYDTTPPNNESNRRASSSISAASALKSKKKKSPKKKNTPNKDYQVITTPDGSVYTVGDDEKEQFMQDHLSTPKPRSDLKKKSPKAKSPAKKRPHLARGAHIRGQSEIPFPAVKRARQQTGKGTLIKWDRLSLK